MTVLAKVTERLQTRIPSSTGGDAARLRAVADRLVLRAREKFPSELGWTVTVKDGIAGWAWPKGTQNESEARKLLGAADAARVLHRMVLVRRGLAEGITLSVLPADRTHSELIVSATVESRLMLYLVEGTMALGALAGLYVAWKTQGADWRMRNYVWGGIIGLVLSVPLALGLGFGARLVVVRMGAQMTKEQGQQHLDELASSLAAG